MSRQVAEATSVDRQLLRAKVDLLSMPLDAAERHVLRRGVDLATEISASDVGHAHYVQGGRIAPCTCGPHDELDVWQQVVRDGRALQTMHNGRKCLDVPVVSDGQVRLVLGVAGQQSDFPADVIAAVTDLAAVAWDVLQRVRSCRSMSDRLNLLHDRQAGVGLVTWEWDPQQDEVHWDGAAPAVIPGLDPHDTSWRQLLSVVDESSARAFRHALREPQFSLEMSGDSPDGSQLRLLCEGSRVPRPDGNGNLLRGTLLDVSVVARLEQAHYRATHDPLTGLPNRAWLMEAIERRMKHRSRRRFDDFALLFIDLDDFKGVNDTYGHVAGDEVLVACAKRIEDVVRRSEGPARFGGDEFVVLEDGPLTWESVEALAQRIRTAVCRPIEVNGAFLRVGASVGVALHAASAPPCDPPPLQELLIRADEALYEAKKSAWRVAIREV